MIRGWEMRGNFNHVMACHMPFSNAIAAPAESHKCGVPDRNPALTKLCRGGEAPPPTACRRYAPAPPRHATTGAYRWHAVLIYIL